MLAFQSRSWGIASSARIPCLMKAAFLDVLWVMLETVSRDPVTFVIYTANEPGNFHTMVTFNAEEKAKAKKIVPEIQKQSVDLNGTVTGEHGIGLEFRDQVVYELGASSVDAWRRVKYALDPLFLLNPGKMMRLKPEASG
jgi:FAD/FMN-containing dehydrogenase